MNELISVIVPIYNGEEFICSCIDSILNQTYSDLEVILIDDGSTDRSGELCDQYVLKDKRVRALHKQNEGTSVARNVGIEAAKGKYIGFVDMDDYIDPHFYDVLHNLIIDNDAQISMVSYWKVRNEKISCWLDSGNEYTLNREEAVGLLLEDNIIQNYVWNKLYRKELFSNIRFPQGVIYDDINVMYELVKNINKIVCLETPLYFYRIHERSIMHKASHKKFTDAVDSVVKRYFEVEQDFPELRVENAISFSVWMCRIYAFMTLEDDFDDAFFKDQMPLLKKCTENYMQYLHDRLEKARLVVLSIILWDIDKGRAVLKTLYGEEGM